jgi:carboxypeptidase Q
MIRRQVVAPLAVLVATGALGVTLLAQVPRETDVLSRIRQEVAARSEIMRTLHQLTDVYGPRLTGSPSTKAAGEWAVQTMTSWGLQNAHLEPWDFGHPGWTNDYVAAHITSPVKDQLAVEVVAWTPGTPGIVRAAAAAITIPERPSERELDAFLRDVHQSVQGRIVLIGKPARVPVTLSPRPARYDDERLRQLYDPDSNRAAPPSRPPSARAPMSFAQIARRVDDFLVSAGAVARVTDAGRELGQIIAFNSLRYDTSKVVPTVVMRNEDYGRIWRLVSDGRAVALELQIVNTTYPDGRTSYNTIAEIPGSDKRQEVVMLGGHLDSWHSATGATDNAAGCAVMMEAVRVIQALGLRPRRTIRVALWTGEEQGLLGSQAYVRKHFGPVETPLPDHPLLAAYLNLDTGTGKVRGASVFGPSEAADVLRDLLRPVADLGSVGATNTSRRELGSTDSGSFNAAGLPGVNFLQDPIQYEAATHHTNLDTLERIVDEDLRASAIVVAHLAYELASREQPLPRFARSSMPSSSWR